jgi:hypothetical protein
MKLNKIGVTAASLVVLAFGSSNAFAGAMGSVSIGTGHTWQDEEDAEDQDDAFMNLFVGGKVNIPYSQTVNLQLDAFGDAAYANEDDDNNYGTGVGVGAHINYRDAQGLLGVFAATGRVPRGSTRTPCRSSPEVLKASGTAMSGRCRACSATSTPPMTKTVAKPAIASGTLASLGLARLIMRANA